MNPQSNSRRCDERKERVDTGVRRTPYGWEAYIRVDGRSYWKHFRPDTPIDDLRLWRARKKAEHRGLLKGNPRIARLFKGLSAPLTRSTNGWCYIYVIQDGSLVKIGKALDPVERCRNLQSAHSRPLTLIAAIPAHASLEGAIHQRFQYLREHTTEWFRLDDALELFIEQMRAGQNPVALLW